MPYFLTIFVIFTVAFFRILAGDDISGRLVRLNDQLTLSNYSIEEKNHNLLLTEEAYNCLKFLSTADLKGTQLGAYLHLSYKLANFFQQMSRPIDAEIVLTVAFQILEKSNSEIMVLPIEEVCKYLSEEDPYLPSFYAALCHYKAKQYLIHLSVQYPSSPLLT